jgi:hypothetical protein
LRTLIAIAAGTISLSVSTLAAVAGPPEYNRGYDDCLAGRYDEAQNSRSYRQGCRAAEDERGMDARPPHWRSTVGFPNVNGMEPVQALAAMQSRGYRNVGTSVAGGMIVGIYFNPVTRECVQVTSANNRVVDARDNITDRRCR